MLQLFFQFWSVIVRALAAWQRIGQPSQKQSARRDQTYQRDLEFAWLARLGVAKLITPDGTHHYRVIRGEFDTFMKKVEHERRKLWSTWAQSATVVQLDFAVKKAGQLRLQFVWNSAVQQDLDEFVSICLGEMKTRTQQQERVVVLDAAALT